MLRREVVVIVSEGLKARIEHEVDSRSVGAGVWLYRATRGRVTRLWHRRAIVLTSPGRRSGKPRTVLVQVFPDESGLYVVAANSGLPRPPGWYFNLMAEPRVEADLDGRRLCLRAELLTEADAAEVWDRVVLTAAPDYERYVRRTGKVPPIFHLADLGAAAT